MKYIIANWKAHKTVEEVNRWFTVFLAKLQQDSRTREIIESKARVVICPPTPFITLAHTLLKGYPSIFVGTQDISAYDEGSDTGETTAKMLQGVVRFAIVGHSERRYIFHETEPIIENKVKLAKQYDIEPVLCIRDEKDRIYPEATFIAYEPHESIGTGKYKSVDEILAVRGSLPLNENQIFLYGGSVNENVCKNYFDSNQIHGLLIGNASLDPLQFFQIVSQVG